ncbi:hypothetical protein BDB00DRAFT_503011 [Zychaea mexicana]|uniref:uncharacterized protein n=1 Tax=Zychaea mexicana TaxID=64656 RepID=UPI0022FDFCD2|nr:uncharacterized protein BDB00DRAFT_503011 [Zychaea mexicana]KAI9498192.1 hypothetical protein BDB00DRAFT_503011 [Zychaea mexicana]
MKLVLRQRFLPSFKKHSEISSLPQLLFILALILLPLLVQAQDSCQPSSCAARCNGACGSNQVCTLGTMTECGVCPSSKCVDQTVLGLPPESSPSSATTADTSDPSTSPDSDGDSNSSGGGDDKGALIGGLVGGLVGGLLLFACVGFWVVRRLKGRSKNTLPFTQQRQMSERSIATTNNHREITSGVIPVAYIPPSPEESNVPTTITAAAAAAAAAGNAAAEGRSSLTAETTNNVSAVGNDADSNRRQSKYLSASYESDGDESIDTRTSIASTISNQPTTPARTTYAVQVQRARPQIMRVNQVLVSDTEGNGTSSSLGGGSTGLSRSGSVRTVLTRDDGSEAGSVVHLSRSNTAPARRLLTNRTPRPTAQQRSSMIQQRHQQQPRPTTIINTDPSLIEATVNKSVVMNRGSPRSEDDPFHDRHSALIESMAATPTTGTPVIASNSSNDTSSAVAGTRHLSNTPTTDSRNIGDGEITIYWNNAYDQQQQHDENSSNRISTPLRPPPRPSTSSSPSTTSTATSSYNATTSGSKPRNSNPPPPPSRPVSLSQHP